MLFCTVNVLLAVVSWSFFQQSDAIPCRGNITIGPEDKIISSDNFPSPYEDITFCRWYVTGPVNTQIRMTFSENFDVEKSSTGSCYTSDFLTVFDTVRPAVGASLGKLNACSSRSLTPSYGPFCGNTPPAPITTASNTAVINFCADYGVTGNGWQITLEHIPLPPKPEAWVPVNVTLEKPTDVSVIESPNFPDNYYPDYSALYIIRNLKKEMPVQLSAISFNLGNDCYDKVVVRDVTNNVSYSFCGTQPLSVLEIRNTENVHVTFTSDLVENYKGFSIEVSLLTCSSNTFACDDNQGCYNASSACDGIRNCADGSDENLNYCAPECGVPHFSIKSLTNRIVGGVIVNRHSLPWQAAMLRNGGQFCGGTIISDQWVLSAAHCFTSPSIANLKVRVGGHTLSLSAANDRAAEIEFAKIVCHPYYGKPGLRFDYDYCLIKLKQKIPFRKNILPACIPHQGDDVEPDSVCIVSGWGDTLLPTAGRGADSNIVTQDVNKVASNNLRQVFAPVIDRHRCNTTNSTAGKITDRMICVGTPEGGTGSCHGDSGGPLVCQNTDRRWSVSGSVSWGPNVCASPNYAAVYSRTGWVTNWIINTITTN